MLLAGGSWDKTARIWNLDTGKLVSGPFKSEGRVGAVQFSADSKKLAVKLVTGKCLEIWDVWSRKLDAKVGNYTGLGNSLSPVFWTNNNKTIIAAFSFTKDDDPKTIYEFDGLTLETVGSPFEGHTDLVRGLALSFDGALLASTSQDNTIKLWAFESRQLLASFDAQDPLRLILSPDSRQLAYATTTKDDCKICICDTPPDVLSQARVIARKKSTLNHLLHSHATRPPPAGHCKPPIFTIPVSREPPPTRDQQQPSFSRLSKFLRFSPRTNVSRPSRKNQLCDPLDVPATLPLPSSLSAQTVSRFDQFEIGYAPPPSNGVIQFLQHHVSFLAPRHGLEPPVVEVAPGRKVARLSAVKLPEYRKVDDTRHLSSQDATMPQENNSDDVDSLPDVHWCKAFLCYYSCWSHGRLKMPPRWRLERVDIPRQGGTANNSRGGAHGRT